MRKTIIASIAAILASGSSCMAQDVWELAPTETTPKTETKTDKPKKEATVKENPDAKYLKGAVTEVDGKVVWTMELHPAGKSAQQLYDLSMDCLNSITKTDNQLDGSKIALVNKKDHIIVANFREWLVFKSQWLALDRTKFYYTIIATCKDNYVKIEMMRLNYLYDENDGKGEKRWKAENIITDANALNKKQTKLVPGYAKFRRKTVDRKDSLFSTIKDYFDKH